MASSTCSTSPRRTSPRRHRGPADSVRGLRSAGNSLFVVEHDLDVIRHADWIVDVGPGAGEKGGQVPTVVRRRASNKSQASQTRRYRSGDRISRAGLRGSTRHGCDWKQRHAQRPESTHVAFPLGVFTTVTGVSGSGKSSLVSPGARWNWWPSIWDTARQKKRKQTARANGAAPPEKPTSGRIAAAWRHQAAGQCRSKPIGRTPRSNLGDSYTGLFDHVRKLFADTKSHAPALRAGRFSFPTGPRAAAKLPGRRLCIVELFFLPSVYAPAHLPRRRYNAKTLEVKYRRKGPRGGTRPDGRRGLGVFRS